MIVHIYTIQSSNLVINHLYYNRAKLFHTILFYRIHQFDKTPKVVNQFNDIQKKNILNNAINFRYMTLIEGIKKYRKIWNKKYEMKKIKQHRKCTE